MTELPGGFINKVVRIGNSVHRPGGTEFSRNLLKQLQDWPGSPNLQGTDADGLEVLSYIDGHVPWDQPMYSPESLASAASLLREFHDLTGGTVCHNDIAPRNTVYRGQTAVAFIDWDNAARGEPLHDVAHMCWQYTELGGAPERARQQIRVITDTYGIAADAKLIDIMLWWQERCWRGIETLAQQGDQVHQRLVDLGAVSQIQQTQRWVELHAQVLAGRPA